VDYTLLPADELVKTCLNAGSPGAWEEFVRRFQKLIATVVLRTARRFGESDPQLVSDLVQETYLKLCSDDARLLRSFTSRHEGAIFGYLKVVTSNLVHDYFKAIRSQKRGGVSNYSEYDESEASVAAPAHDLDRDILIQEIDVCLQGVCKGVNSRRDRAIFWLYYREGLSASAIASLPTIDLTVKGVETTLLRLARLVREQLHSESGKPQSRGPSETGSVGSP
jgi:RNA polymerase sigma-70 factor (ECF subfamily)